MAGRFTSRGASAVELDAASNDRLADANTLRAGGRSGAAIAAGLYALETRLKALVCKRLDLENLPTAVQIHDLEELLVLAGLSRKINDPGLANVKWNWDNIVILSGRLNDLRYTPDAAWAKDVAAFFAWLEDPSDGVIPCLLSQP